MEIERPRTEGQLRQRKAAASSSVSATAAAPARIASPSVPEVEGPSVNRAATLSSFMQQASQIQRDSGLSEGAVASSCMRTPDRIEYPDLSEPGAAEMVEIFPGGLQPSAPSFAEPMQPGEYRRLESEPLMAQSVQQPRQGRPILQTQNGPRPLSPDALARLEHLRAKARLAEAREVATVAAQKRGELPPDEVLPIQEVQYRVKVGDDLTDLAVRFGSSVASIQAANRKVVWQHNIDHVAGELITIPATRMGPEVVKKDPAISAEQAQANKEFALCRTFQAESRSRASEEEARFYLEDNNWNLGAALQQYRDDVEWEKAQKAGGGKSQPMHAMQAMSGSKGKSSGGSRFF